MLTESIIKNLKTDNKRIRRSDGNGLYIIVEKNRKYFVYEYRDCDKKVKRKFLANYPECSLKQARELMKQISIDTKSNVGIKQKFDYLIDEFLNYERKRLRTNTFRNKELIIKVFIFSYLKGKNISEITKFDILKIFDNPKLEGTMFVKSQIYYVLQQFFDFCYLICENNPMANLKKKYITNKEKINHYPILNKDNDIRLFLTALKNIKKDNIMIYYAFKFALYTALRRKNILLLEWSEIDFDKSMIFIKAEKMKNNKDFSLPLSKQAKNILIKIFDFNYTKRKYVFSHFDKPYSEAIFSFYLKKINYNNIITFHSFRGIFSTICNEHRKEHNIHYDIIEKCLSHQDRNIIRATYNHADNLNDMRILMQWYSNFIDKLSD